MGPSNIAQSYSQKHEPIHQLAKIREQIGHMKKAIKYVHPTVDSWIPFHTCTQTHNIHQETTEA
jgi:hypothetical protein